MFRPHARTFCCRVSRCATSSSQSDSGSRNSCRSNRKVFSSSPMSCSHSHLPGGTWAHQTGVAPLLFSTMTSAWGLLLLAVVLTSVSEEILHASGIRVPDACTCLRKNHSVPRALAGRSLSLLLPSTRRIRNAASASLALFKSRQLRGSLEHLRSISPPRWPVTRRRTATAAHSRFPRWQCRSLGPPVYARST